jgi:hypothetical protein
VQRLAIALVMCLALECASLATVLAIGRAAPSPQLGITVAAPNCPSFFLAGTLASRCPRR